MKTKDVLRHLGNEQRLVSEEIQNKENELKGIKRAIIALERKLALERQARNIKKDQK